MLVSLALLTPLWAWAAPEEGTEPEILPAATTPCHLPAPSTTAQTAPVVPPGPLGGDVGLDGTAEDYDDGEIAVVFVDDFYSGSSINYNQATERFYETHGDLYDFLVFFPVVPHSDGTSATLIRNDVLGIHMRQEDIGKHWGSDEELELVAHFWSLDTFPTDPAVRIPGNNDSTVSLIAHEIAHRWGAYIRFDDDPGPDVSSSNALLGRSLTHWCFYHHTPGTGPCQGASVLEGNRWQDNGDGTYTTAAPTDGYSPLDQYLMGIRAPEQVPNFWFVQDPDLDGTTCSRNPWKPDEEPPITTGGQQRLVSIGDVIVVEGNRYPTSATSQRYFRTAFVLLATSTRLPTVDEVAKLDGFRTAFEGYFNQETGGEAIMETRLGEVLRDFDQDGYFDDVDCDDHDAEIFPGAAEVCDGLDNNCDGQVDGLGPLCEDHDLAASAADATILGSATGDRLGAALLGADLNGDGMDDLLVGAPGASGPDGTRTGAGAVYLFLGRPDFPALIDLALEQADSVIHGAAPGDGLGTSLGAGQVFSDDLAELAAGAPGTDGPVGDRDGAGAVIFLEGQDPWPTEIDLAAVAPIRTFHGARAGDRLGAAVAILNIDGGAYGDLLMGAPGDEDGDASGEDEGAVHTLFGKKSLGSPKVVDLLDTTLNLVVRGEDAGDRLGEVLAGPDHDGDGTTDLAMGAPGAAGVGNALPAAGAVYLIFGDAGLGGLRDLSVQAADMVVHGGGAGDGLGYAMDALDLDGDGFTDLAAGAPGSDGPTDLRPAAGQVALQYGGERSGLPAEVDLALGVGDLVIHGAAAGDALGASISSGSLDTGPREDLLMAAPAAAASGGEPQTGQVLLLYGAALSGVRDLAVTPADRRVYGPEVGLGAGLAVAGIDLNDDGWDDLAAGYPSAGSEAGQVHLLSPVDADRDGIPNWSDNCIRIPNPVQVDGDGDGRGDLCDACPLDPDNDQDLDGLCADLDNCPGEANTDQADLDGDGSGDVCDPDDDGDGTDDGEDPCPRDPANDEDGDDLCADEDNCPLDYNPGQEDNEGDGTGDVCDDDDDNDGALDASDNCPFDHNPGQEDLDGDGTGDVCDDDVDGDGVPNTSDCAPQNSAVHDVPPELGNVLDYPSDAAGLVWAPEPAAEQYTVYCSIFLVLERGDPSDPACLEEGLPGTSYQVTEVPPEEEIHGFLVSAVNCFGEGPLGVGWTPEDPDGDDLCIAADNCPAHDNPGQEDGDGDGVGDDCDNCPNTWNPDQADSDGDGTGDACES